MFGTDAHPDAALFADRLARAVNDVGSPVEAGPAKVMAPMAAGDPPEVSETGSLNPAVRSAAFGTPRHERQATAPGSPGADDVAPDRPELVALPHVPAVLCDRAERIVRANAAFLALAGRPVDGGGGGLPGMRLPQTVVGPDVDARLVRADGALTRVRVVRWDVPDRELQVVVLVELGEPGGTDRGADRRWVTELERLAGAGTWTYDLATTTLRRSEGLRALYRSVGVGEDGAPGAGPVEGEQVALLCQALRSDRGNRNSHAELRLPGKVVLSCSAEVEHAVDGTPVRLVGVVRDVATQRRAEARLRHSGQRFADLMELSPAGVGLLDAAGRVVDANPAMCALLDRPLERLRGIDAADLWAEAPRDPLEQARIRPDWLRDVEPGAANGYRLEQVALRRGDGTTVWCELAVSVTTTDDGGRFWLVVCTDIGERRRAAEVLRTAGTVDQLTRLPNREGSLELLDALLRGPDRERIAVVCGDLDDFQRVNSSLGHEAGDELLVAIAGRLQRELPHRCTAARLPGDQFLVICADHAEAGGPDLLAGTVAELLRCTVTVQGRPVQLTASVGLATVPGPPLGGEVGWVRAADLLRFAEVAMHEAKRGQPRGAVGVATDGVVSSARRALELEAQLRAAIAEGGLLLEYQPVVGPGGAVRSAEALVRWPHPEHGLVAPSDFLPVAQRSGLLRELDLWVLRTATREAATWLGHGGNPTSVAVNLAGLLPGDRDFLTLVTDIVGDAGLPWDRLVLELVETSLMALPACALAAMAELVDRGVRFAVDDFGTGYSSLARLKELPAQIVKVDRAFVTGIATDPADFAVARAVVDMAQAMGRSCVAEGVETAEQFHVLRGIGVDAYQGWLFSRSVPAAGLREILAGGPLPTPAAARRP